MKKIFFILSVIIIISLSFFLFYFSKQNQPLTLTILHTNDLHSHFLPWSKDSKSCDNDTFSCLGGFARLKTVIDNNRKENPDLLLFDAGDRFSGTVFYTLRKSQDLSQLLNTFNYDAITVGNHDFDDGLPELTQFTETSNAPLVISNVSFPRESKLNEKTTSTLVLERQNKKIGIIGVLTEEAKTTSGNAQDITVLPVIQTVKKEINSLKEKGISIIIVLSHIGLDIDQELAQNCPEIDIIIGGHTHSLLSNKKEADAVGPYPITITHPDGSKTLIVSTGMGGKYLGKLSVTFDTEGFVTSYQGDTLPIDNSIIPNSIIQNKIEIIQDKLNNILNTPVFSTLYNLDLTPNQLFCSESCAIGEALTDALKQSSPQADFAFINAGGIRAGLPAGQVTFQQLIQSYPFDSSVVTVKMTGQDIRSYLEYGLKKYTSNDRTNAFLQTSGLGYHFDANTKKITHIFLTDTPNKNLMDSQIYTVILPSFLAKGGDGFPIFPIEQVISFSVRDEIKHNLEQNSPSSFQNRIQKSISNQN